VTLKNISQTFHSWSKWARSCESRSYLTSHMLYTGQDKQHFLA